jgi:hypothetical protein
MTPEALDLMQREKLTKMVIKDYYLENKPKDSILRIDNTNVISETQVLGEIVFDDILQNILEDPLFAFK